MEGGRGRGCVAAATFARTRLGFWISKPVALVMPGSLALWRPWRSGVIACKGTAQCCQMALMMANAGASVNK